MSLNFDGLPVIFETATAYLTPLVTALDRRGTGGWRELLGLVTSYFLTPVRASSTWASRTRPSGSCATTSYRPSPCSTPTPWS